MYPGAVWCSGFPGELEEQGQVTVKVLSVGEGFAPFCLLFSQVGEREDRALTAEAV